MKLRITTLLIIGMTFIGLVVVLLGNLNAILTPFFQRQEQTSAIANVHRAEAVLTHEKQSLAQKAALLADSSAIHNFLQSHDPQVLDDVINSSTFTDLQLNVIAVLDVVSQSSVGKMLNGNTQALVSIPPTWTSALFQTPQILQLSSGELSREGFLKTDLGLFLIGIRSLPGNSLLLVSVLMQGSQLSDLSDQVLFPTDLIPVDAAHPPTDYADVLGELLNSSTPTTRILSTDAIAGYSLQYGLDKTPAALLQVSTSRSTSQGSQLVLNYLIIILVSATAIFSLMTYLLVQFVILSRVTRLSSEVAKIGANPSMPGRVTVARKDEVSTLALNINAMLTGLEQARADLEQSYLQVQSGRKRLEDLSHRLVTIQEEERHAIALELHDEIGQMLTGLKLQLENAATLSAENQKKQLKQAQTLTSELIQRVRQLSLNLRPSMLDDLGLLPAVQWLTTQYTAQTGIKVNLVHKDIEGERFSPEVEITAYRAIQEGLTNIARHARTKKAEIVLKSGSHLLQIQISDQGVGFNPKTILEKRETNGLSGIRERVAMLGGNFTIRSKPHQGTSLTVELPVKGHLERRHRVRSHPAG